MSFVQRLFKGLLPRSWSDSMEAESRQWMMQCPCGHEISVWDAGGIRWKAAGEPLRRRICPECGLTWHKVYKKDAPAKSE